MASPSRQRRSSTLNDAGLKIGIVERYIHDVMNARSDLIENGDRRTHAASNRVLTDTAIFFADHMQAVVAARERLSRRTDVDGRAMHALIDEVVLSHAGARDVTLAALRRLRQRS